ISATPDPARGPVAKVPNYEQRNETEGSENLPFSQGELSLPTVSVMLHDYGGHVDVATIANPQKCTTACQTTASFKEAAVQTGPIVVTQTMEMGTQSTAV
ncbi:hypothetical protein BaRGS_00014412, partial [Batillaria attramentaria]